MAVGVPGADSSNLVTSQIGGQNLIDLATNVFGRPPVVWGRYFTSVASTGVVEYRHLQENQALRSSGMRVLPIARQTKRVNGSVVDGSADAMANAEDLILTFGADYLASQGRHPALLARDAPPFMQYLKKDGRENDVPILLAPRLREGRLLPCSTRMSIRSRSISVSLSDTTSDDRRPVA
jgi:hypothetical protein